MASQDLIMNSFKQSWNLQGNSSLVPLASIYYGRAEQPNGLAGFPYIRCFIDEDEPEITTNLQDAWLCTYHLLIEVWTTQGMTGTSGDQIPDQGNIMRAIENTFRIIAPSKAWISVSGYLSNWKAGVTTLDKDNEIYLGKDRNGYQVIGIF